MQLNGRRGGRRGSLDVQQTHDPNIRVVPHIEEGAEVESCLQRK
jgi:hypothetical protein